MILDHQEHILMQFNNVIQWIPVISKYMIYYVGQHREKTNQTILINVINLERSWLVEWVADVIIALLVHSNCV